MFTGFLGLVHLFFIFFYVGLFAVGGGLVAAGFMQQILVDRYHIISAEKFFNMLAISESTPGPIGINLATYCGNELYGPLGGFVTTLGEVLPSIIIIMLVSRFFFNGFQKKPLVQSAFSTLRPATGGIILVSLVNVFIIALLDVPTFRESSEIADLFAWKSVIFYGLCMGVLFFVKKMHPVYLVLAGAIFGILFL